jgi:hypothetical protein
MILVQHEGIVEIPTDFFGWFEERMERQMFRETCNGPGRRQHTHLDIAGGLEFSLYTTLGELCKFQGRAEFAPSTIAGGKSGSEQYQQHHSIPDAGKHWIQEPLPEAEGDQTACADQDNARQEEPYPHHGPHTWQEANQ